MLLDDTNLSSDGAVLSSIYCQESSVVVNMTRGV